MNADDEGWLDQEWRDWPALSRMCRRTHRRPGKTLI